METPEIDASRVQHLGGVHLIRNGCVRFKEPLGPRIVGLHEPLSVDLKINKNFRLKPSASDSDNLSKGDKREEARVFTGEEKGHHQRFPREDYSCGGARE